MTPAGQADVGSPRALFACVCVTGATEGASAHDASALAALAADFSPRFEVHGGAEHGAGRWGPASAERDAGGQGPTANLVVIDVAGLSRLLGDARAIGVELQRAVRARGLAAHIAVASTQTAAIVLAHARPGLTIVAHGDEAAALAPVRIGVLQAAAPAALAAVAPPSTPSRGAVPVRVREAIDRFESAASAFKAWGLTTLGELAALPAADLAARLGRPAAAWQAMARGEDSRPLVPTLEDERFVSSLDLEWPIEGLEPLSFVLTRLLEPLSTRLERRDRGAAVLHVVLDLAIRPTTNAAREVYARRLELPSPLRDVRTLRTLALLDLESHPPGGPIDRVTVAIDPTPGRILQHTLFTRAQPTPEQMATLVARLGAVMGQDRIGSPGEADSYRPGAFLMRPFRSETTATAGSVTAVSGDGAADPRAERAPVTALRRYRHPLPARVVVDGGVPVRLTIDRRGAGGGAIVRACGPWRVSGQWWTAGTASPISDEAPFDRDEWDVVLGDGVAYRIFRDRVDETWFVDALVD